MREVLGVEADTVCPLDRQCSTEPDDGCPFADTLTSMSDRTDRPLRKDAERNRQRLLTAAGELFAERGLDITLHDIAHRAGVGVGTAYRRFANKEEVIDAYFETKLDDVARLAEQAVHDPDPWNGLVTYLEQASALQMHD